MATAPAPTWPGRRAVPLSWRAVSARPAPSQQSDEPPTQPGGTDRGAGPTDSRLRLYAYLDAREHRRTYVEIMRLFSATLLADLPAGEVASALAQAERDERVGVGESRIENVIPRLKQLAEWGNLVAGRREVVATSIAEFRHGSVRYQVSKLGARVQRDVDELLATAEGAREVSSELLPAIDRGLTHLAGLLAGARDADAADPGSSAARRAREQLAEAVTTVFLQHAELAATVRDFYAYLGHVVSRSQLEPEAIEGFRNLLVEYIGKVVDDVLLHTPAIARTLADPEFRAARGDMLRLLRPAAGLGEDVERARGRSEDDWTELTDWFCDRPGRPSQVAALREATARAIGTLLANVKRATSGSAPLPGRRSELEKLACWFDESTQDRAQRLDAAAFGLYSARHLSPVSADSVDGVTTPWALGPVVRLPVSVRSRGDRGRRGRVSRIEEDPIGAEALLSDARTTQARRNAALAELATAGPLSEATLSAEALDTVCGLLTTAMARRGDVADAGDAADPVHGLRLRIEPADGQSTTIASSRGTLTLHDAVVRMNAEAGSADGKRG